MCGATPLYLKKNKTIFCDLNISILTHIEEVTMLDAQQQQQLSEDIRARFNHQESKRILEEKWNAKLIIFTQYGTWKCSPELMAYLRTETSDTVILLDYYNRPVRVSVEDLLSEVEKTYTEVMSEWRTEFQDTARLR